MGQKLHTSEDGCHTLFSQKYDAHYHSIYGAFDEALHIFIIAGLYYQKIKRKSPIHIFEMGFGSGLNAYLTYIESERLKLTVRYTGIESDPISLDTSKLLNYPSSILNKSDDRFDKLHQLDWNNKHQLSNNFQFRKLHSDIQDYTFDKNYDIIYFDAFAPSCQGFLWEADIHQKFYDALNPQGILVTYCAQGAFKRMLKSLGYKIESLNGPGKKREMVRAIKVGLR